MAHAERGAQFKRHYSKATTGEITWSPVFDDHVTALSEVRRIRNGDSAAAALITDYFCCGQPAAICEVYDFENSVSLMIGQPYRKRMMSWKALGEPVILGPARDLDGP
jgi:hypothetical protein